MKADCADKNNCDIITTILLNWEICFLAIFLLRKQTRIGISARDIAFLFLFAKII